VQAEWQHPVVLKLDPADNQSIVSAREAVDSLMRWPWRHSKSYRKAVRLCLFALVGEQTPQKARAAFVNAAKEADYLIQA
jgi:hypothetical protein